MELHEKLLELRKQKGLTQEELAETLYVSRTAISKWESGRGVPNIESLKELSRFYAISLDNLLSSEELLLIAEDDHKRGRNHTRDLLFGLLDCGMSLLLFFPFFGQNVGGQIQEVSLLNLTQIQPLLYGFYLAAVAVTIILGVLTLALQNCGGRFWGRSKVPLSLVCNAVLAALFIISRQPYAAGFAFFFLLIKGALVLKNR